MGLIFDVEEGVTVERYFLLNCLSTDFRNEGEDSLRIRNRLLDQVSEVMRLKHYRSRRKRLIGNGAGGEWRMENADGGGVRRVGQVRLAGLVRRWEWKRRRRPEWSMAKTRTDTDEQCTAERSGLCGGRRGGRAVEGLFGDHALLIVHDAQSVFFGEETIVAWRTHRIVGEVEFVAIMNDVGG